MFVISRNFIFEVNQYSFFYEGELFIDAITGKK